MFNLSNEKESLAIVLADGTAEQIAFLNRAIYDMYSDSPFYKAKKDAIPFVSEGEENKTGKFVVSFWGPPSEVVAYVDWLNNQFEETIADMKASCDPLLFD